MTDKNIYAHNIYNVIIYDVNHEKFEPYNIFPYLINEYNELDVKPTTFEEVREFIRKKSKYMWWSRTQYEIILTDWPCKMNEEKWDIYKQIEMNLDVITELFMKYIIHGNN